MKTQPKLSNWYRLEGILREAMREGNSHLSPSALFLLWGLVRQQIQRQEAEEKQAS